MKKIKLFLKNCGEIIIITLGVGVSLPFVLISVLIDYGKNIGDIVIYTKDNISDAIKTSKIEKLKQNNIEVLDKTYEEENQEELKEDNIKRRIRKK